MNDEELRRLAEHLIAAEAIFGRLDADREKFHAAANPQAILALLDDLRNSAGIINHWTDKAHAAERRVAALEEGLRLALPYLENEYPGEEATVEVRALLAAAPSEPDDNPDYDLADPAALPAEVGFPKQVGDPTNENPYDKAEGGYHAQHAHTEDGYCLLNEEPDPLYSAGRGDISSYDPSQRGER